MNGDSTAQPAPLPAAVPAGTRVYAIGDIHGRMDLLGRLLQDIAQDLEQGPTPERVVVISLGDLIDRGPESKAVVECLLSGAKCGGTLAQAQFITLRGNHEDYLLQFLADFSAAPGWLRNGGLEAIRSYVGHLPDGYATDYPALQRLLYRALPPSHLRFFSRMPLRHVEGDYLFVHAGIRPGVPLDRQDAYDLMWIRGEFLRSTEPAAKIVVHGHTQVVEPEFHPNRIAIDTGAYRSEILTCLVLDGMERRILRT